MCVCVCACVRACVRIMRACVERYGSVVCVYIRVCVHAYVWACLCTYTQFKIELGFVI